MIDSTPAIDAITGTGIDFTVVRTVPARSPEESAELQGIQLAALLRTIVVRRGADDYVFVLVPGGRRFDWPRLRAHLGVSRLSLPDAEEAREVTGYDGHRRRRAGREPAPGAERAGRATRRSGGRRHLTRLAPGVSGA